MAYDEGLAQRLREQFQERVDVEEKKMFAGVCFMVSNHMCCGIVGETLMARVGPANYEECPGHQHASEMDFTGKTMKGMVYVSPEGFEDDSELAHWINLRCSFVLSLPPEKTKRHQN
ncbi:MAG: hypothetical protein ACI9SC_000600 [Gammaproteobacteria bacterium]|jgi:hypothetical protein